MILGAIVAFLGFNKTGMKIFLGLIGLLLVFIAGATIEENLIMLVFAGAGGMLVAVASWGRKNPQSVSKYPWVKTILSGIGAIIVWYGASAQSSIFGF